MARSLAVTDQQARQILAVLLLEKKINARDAWLALARHRKRIAELRAELAHLGGDGPFRRIGGRNDRPHDRREGSGSPRSA